MAESPMTNAFRQVAAAFPSASQGETSVVWRLKIERSGVEPGDVLAGLDALMDEAAIAKFYPDDLMPRLFALAKIAKGKRLEDERRISDPARQLSASTERDPLTVAAYQLAAQWVMRCLAQGRKVTEASCGARAEATREALVLARDNGVTVLPDHRAAWVDGMLAARVLERWLVSCVSERRAA